MGAEGLEPRPLACKTSAACPRPSADVQFSLEIRISHLGVFRWTNPNGGRNGGQTQSQAKRAGLIRFDCSRSRASRRSNQAIATTLFITDKTVEAYVRAISPKPNLPAAADDHRRVLAVLAFLLRDVD